MKICAVDPGLTGGWALLSPDGLLVEPMPVLQVGGKNELDIAGLCSLLDIWRPDHAIVEYQQSMPRQGVSSSFKTGKNFGLLLGLLYGAEIPITIVRAARWKRDMQVPRDKTSARHRATQIFPDHYSSWSRVRDDGIAEAALLAEWGRRFGGF